MSQSAVSRSLGRLRHHFKDELFIRGRYGLEPTDLTLELKTSVLPILIQLKESLEPVGDFDPATLKGPINLAMNSYFANMLSAQLYKVVKKSAPGVQLNILDWDEVTTEKLITREVHATLNYLLPSTSKRIYHKEIAKDRMVLVCRRGHPISKGGELGKDVLSLDIASLNIPHFNDKRLFSKEYFDSIGVQSNLKFRSSYVLAILNTIKVSDLVFPCSELLSRGLGEDFSVVECPPAGVVPSGDIYFGTSRMVVNEPMYKWLELTIKGVVMSL